MTPPRSPEAATAVEALILAATRYVDASQREGCPRRTERLAFEALAQAVARHREMR